MTTKENHPFAVVTKLDGFTTIDGEQIISLEMSDGCSAYIPALAFADGAKSAWSILCQFNIIPLRKVKADIMARLGQIKKFSAANLIAKSGDVAPYFALRDGTVFGPKQLPPAKAIFPRLERRFGQAGTLEGWKTNVAEPAIENPLLSLCLMMAFAGPVLEMAGAQGNWGIQLVGPGGRGKSTALMMAASVIGTVGDGEGYMTSLIATSNGLEQVLPFYQDMLFVLEEGELFSGGDTARAKIAKWREFAHRFYDGHTKLRAGYGGQSAASTQERTRFCFAYSANERLSDVLGGGDSDIDRAVMQRILEVPATRKYGVFDKLPSGIVGGAAFSDQLKGAMRKHHGVAFRTFLQRFVQARHEGPERLRARIEYHVARFERRVALDANDGEAARAARTFAIIYVAGRMARHYGVLPAEFKPMKTALACYRHHREAVLHRQTFTKRLEAYASRPDLIRIDRGSYPSMTNQELRACPGFIAADGDETLLLLTRSARNRAFPDWTRVADGAKSHLIVGGEKNLDIKRKVRANAKNDRMFVFRIG